MEKGKGEICLTQALINTEVLTGNMWFSKKGKPLSQRFSYLLIAFITFSSIHSYKDQLHF